MSSMIAQFIWLFTGKAVKVLVCVCFVCQAYAL